MKRNHAEPSIVWVCLIWLAAAVWPQIAFADDEAAGEALIEALGGGGYVLYFRHTATDWTQQDRIEKAQDWESCSPATARQLSEEGRNTAREVGEAMRVLEVPVGRVLASPYCRTVETARLMDVGELQTTTGVINMRVADYFGGPEAVIKTARELLSTPPPEGTNTVIVAHGNLAREATPVYPGEGECVVFQPGEDGHFTVIGRLTPEQWKALKPNDS